MRQASNPSLRNHPRFDKERLSNKVDYRRIVRVPLSWDTESVENKLNCWRSEDQRRQANVDVQWIRRWGKRPC